jgi:hypothetical protein
MRRLMLAAAAAAVMAVAGCGGDDEAPAAQDDGVQAAADASDDQAEDADDEAEDTDDGHVDDDGSGDPEVTPELADQVAGMRAATARYANDLDAALDDGFFIITQHIEDMGYHFLNPAVEDVDLANPPILVYARDGEDWQLVAYEWVFPEEPAEPPMDGASYGEFPAACHYDDGMFVAAADEEACAETHPDTDAGFTFWHPDLVTFHVWAGMHNPDGLYHGTNPLMAAYNE